jgi:hypothetical protein
MSRERSCFEHKGMPLAAETAGHMRAASAPWLQSFGVRPVPGPDPMKALAAAPVNEPEPQMFDYQHEFELGHSRPNVDGGRSETGTAPGLQRSTSANPSSFTGHSGSAVAGQRPASTSTMGGTKDGSPKASFSVPNTATAPLSEALAQSSGLPVGIDAAIPEMRPETESARGIDSGQPHVTVQKHVSIQQVVSPVFIGQPAGAGPSTSASHTQPGELPFASVTSREFHIESVAHTATGTSVAKSSPELEPVAATRTGQMGGGTLMQGPVMMPSISRSPKSHSHGNDLLERLNQHNPQHEGGKRVHIRNLHVTVQKAAASQQQQPAQGAQQQAAPAAVPQTFFNPWERHYSAFD